MMMGYQSSFLKDSFIHETAIIESGVELGPFVVIGPHVHIKKGTRIEGFCSIGMRPEHKLHWHVDSEHGVEIGANCVIREFTTINSGSVRTTKIGNGVSMLRGSHVGHDAIIGNDVTLSCNVLVGGHCFVGQGSNVGLGGMIHQFRAIGAYSMIGMGSVVTKDVPCFEKWYGNPAKGHGLNSIGCERAGLNLPIIQKWKTHGGTHALGELYKAKVREILEIGDQTHVFEWLHHVKV